MLRVCRSVVNQPVILPPLSSLSRAMKIGLSSKTQSQMEMTVLSKWTIRPRLMAVPGVANVAIWGDYDKQFQVLVDPDRLRAHGLSLNQVMPSVGNAVKPALRRVSRYAQSAIGRAAHVGSSERR